MLGDFIKGRLLFIGDFCAKGGLDKGKALEAVRTEAVRLAGTPERASFLEEKVFGSAVLSCDQLPDWVDGIFLEAMTVALKGSGSPLHTSTSRRPCITFEAGRFNAHRQADTVFKVYFSGKRPEDWLRGNFLAIHRQCYGEEAARKSSVEELAPGQYRVTMGSRGLDKVSRTDCSTVVGYLYGALEKLGAHDILVTHDQCGADPGTGGRPCVFELRWK